MSASRLPKDHHNHDHPKLGRFLIGSLVIHTLVVVLLTGGLFDVYRRTKPPVYFVDLIHKPVLNPQAGRPDPRPASKPKAAVKKPAAVAKPKPKPVKAAQAKPKPKPKPAPQPKPDKRAEQQRKAAIEELRQKQARQAEMDALKEKLAKLQAGAAAVPKDVPVGMPEGTGDEVGVSVISHIQGYIQENWALSPYLLDQSRIGSIEARVLLAYSASGELTRYRFVDPSGNNQFDDSIKRAIIKSKQLPQKLPKKVELTVVFNLKEMATTRR